MGEGRSEVAADRAAHRMRRGERELIGRKPRQHRAKRVGPEPLRGKDEAPLPRALLEQAARKALARTCRGGGGYFRGGKLCPERRAAVLRQRAVIILRIEPAIGDHHLVRMHAPAKRNRVRPRQRGGIDEAAEKEAVLGFKRRAPARDKARKRPFGQAKLRHKHDGNAPSILPRSICNLKMRRNIGKSPSRCIAVVQCKMANSIFATLPCYVPLGRQGEAAL